MTTKQRNNLIRILATAALLVVLAFVDVDRPVKLILYLVPYLIVGYDILKKAGQGIVNRQPLDENLLMAVATVGALVLAVTQTGDFTEAVAVMLFYQVGEFFQSYAVGKSRQNIGELMDIRPDTANIEDEEGVHQVDPDEVEIGSLIVVRPGEKIPIDGIVEEGKASLDTSALTGESVLRNAVAGDEVISGCIDINGVLKIRTTREFGESTASKILELVEDASSRKSRSENFISRFARIYTPVVVIGAGLLALLPPVIRMAFLGAEPLWGEWLYRALTFLVVSCPCALVISIPLSFFAGIGGASHEGILVKGSNYLEAMAKIRTVVMDKTGTLTRGVFQVRETYPEEGFSEEELLDLAASAEVYSSHPIALALKQARSEGEAKEPEEVEEIAGKGICARLEGRKVWVGNAKLMEMAGAGTESTPEEDKDDKEETRSVGTVVHVAVEDRYAGSILIADELKETARSAVEGIKRAGVSRIVMLTGDAKAPAKAVAKELGIGEVHSELLPGDKVDLVEKMLAEEREKGCLAFVGDGINDAPVLSRSDIGIAMGALGSEAAIEAADVVLMDDDPEKIALGMRISRKCMRIVKENIWLAIGVKVVCLLLCAFGVVGMWAAIFADVGVMVLAVLNAIRTLFVKKAR